MEVIRNIRSVMALWAEHGAKSKLLTSRLRQVIINVSAYIITNDYRNDCILKGVKSRGRLVFRRRVAWMM